MKTLHILLATFFLTTLSVSGQITKGNFMVGGSGSFSSKESFNNEFKNDKLKFSEFNLNLNCGYHFIDKLQGGTRITYYQYLREGDDLKYLKYGIYSRYYLLKNEKLINLFIEGNYFLGQNLFNDNRYKDNLSGYKISAGPTIFLNNSVALEMDLSYSSTKFKGVNNSTENNLQIGVGFQIFLEKK